MGEPISPREYLEASLSQQESFSSDAQARNRVRRILTSFFKKRECVTLVRPLEDESRLQQLDSIPESQLRRQFVEQMAELRNAVIYEVRTAV
jgi:hypothetical protein